MPKEKKPRTVEVAHTLALPVADSMRLTIWDLRFEKEGTEWYLRYFIDKPGGVNIQDCEGFSRAVEKLLDEADPIDSSYILEVSSPGIERVLSRPEHFAFYIGSRVHIRLIRPHEGARDLYGQLVSRSEEGEVAIRLPDESTLTIPKANIAKVKLVADI